MESYGVIRCLPSHEVALMPIAFYLPRLKGHRDHNSSNKPMGVTSHIQLEVKSMDVGILNKKLENHIFGTQTNVYI